MNMQNNQVAPAHQKLATFKPSKFQMTQPMMGLSNQLRAGPALRMELREESILEAQQSVVDI